ncbi:unnamed protein product [Linum tenue]|uniref:Uncharacterized protein n=1 Tax=Linum tenue TaxID=586396 RepID=A0AAV0L8V4_9ROSI|nr:unnamed protein product [Linum tenue]CAI0458264.1 unnamed protein product [Linum tenue]
MPYILLLGNPLNN